MNDFSSFTKDQLLAEQKKIKQNELLTAGGIGFLIAIMVYGLIKNGFGVLYTLIPIVFIAGLLKNSKTNKVKLERIQEELTKN